MKVARKNKTYGLPYMGSKSAIAEWICSYLPPADNFYDLFCGGCAVTHAALLLKNYNQYVINDINPMATKLFYGAVNGIYEGKEKEWISREEFDKRKNTDEFVAYVWSFGNNLKGYMYSPAIAPFKEAIHRAIFDDNFTLLKNFGCDATFLLRYKNANAKYFALKEYARKKGFRIDLENSERTQRADLQSLESSLRLQSLERSLRLESLERSCADYRNVPIRKNSVLYCDIPYEGTAQYVTGNFEYNAFYEWAKKQTEPVIISSYQMPDDFVCIARTSKIVTLSAKNNRDKAYEGLFVPAVQIEKGIFKFNPRR